MKKATTKRVRNGDRCNEIHDKDATDFVRAVNMLNSVMTRVQAYLPEANYYLANNELHLMAGPTHTEDSAVSKLPENMALSWPIKSADGGGW